MKSLQLEQSFSGHQKVMIGLGTITFCIKSFNALNNLDYTAPAWINALPFILISILFIGIFFLQNGFIAYGNDKVARAWFWYTLPVWKKEIDQKKYPIISTLKMGKKQKLGFTLAVNPDLAVDYSSYDITSLNYNHTIKDRHVILKQEHQAKNAILFLLNHSILKEEFYSPDFSR
ncbi:hypothetical protein CW736_01260 [Nonlabens sp. MB-3u-79]|jgi:hypothetical protein|uniref:hypothetical protein n=1 Tax=Nonlabens sp. MB-3u-79 TaxID=2058134 RepID=UPI000C30450E|nr:hypothetical protein [Nonlabens sp. MB-3u-79]AUC78118.1 hypothetical protein CW736_01260 [Nonlabens sp. MB-3u-79]|tara:strand:- start:9866 stop:10390 length:525 start_codon:yes stop_codon:yes gene_type:complete